MRTSARKNDMNDIFDRLSRSDFRRRFHLGEKEKEYIRCKGYDTICEHTHDFINKRLAPAVIPNDGKQTPMRGHPTFIAQHATATCCRSCLNKWYGILSITNPYEHAQTLKSTAILCLSSLSGESLTASSAQKISRTFDRLGRRVSGEMIFK